MPSISVGSNNLSDCKLGTTSISIQLGSTEYFTPGGSGGGVPSWWTSEMQNSYQSAMSTILDSYWLQMPAWEQRWNSGMYCDIASLGEDNKVYVTRFMRAKDGVQDWHAGDTTQIVEGEDHWGDPNSVIYDEHASDSWDAFTFTIYYDNSQWSQNSFNYNGNEFGYYGANTVEIGEILDFNYSEFYENISAQTINGQVQQFVCYSNVPYNTPSLLPVNTPVTTS